MKRINHNGHSWENRMIGHIDVKRDQGSYRQARVKSKDFSRTSKRHSYCFQGLKTYENTD